METQSRNEVESIFFEAIEKKSAADRDAFLSKACGNNSELREEVEALVAAQQTPDTFLHQPVVGLFTTVGAAIEEQAGSQIGRYKLLEQLGEGGFGVVFMAEQTSPVRRRVAMKIVKPGMDSKEVIARFEAERQALAMMDHPNIARILDGGTTDSGRPYFVMDLVKGASITEYCDANRLNTRERLQLFQQVCRAIQHAHQKGIIHRDLKPTNVMVTLHDGEPVPKVIDFGVSKALSQPLTEKTLFTRYGQIVGTPQYMSPEQAEMSGLDVDTRSDVYSLGVLLYELLTGSPPFDSDTLRKAGFDGMRRIIRNQEPVKPSTALSTLQDKAATLIAWQRSVPPNALRASVAGDLDWIVMKCLEKDRNRRYETANDLIRDIDRHLADKPITAKRPTITYQISKYWRRHRAAVSVASIVLATLVLGLGFTAYAWAQEREAKQQAEEAQRETEVVAEVAQKRADALEKETLKAKKTIEVFQRLLGGASPEIKQGPDATVRSFLNIFAEDLEKNRFDEPEVELVVRESLGAAYQRFSENALAAKQFEKAIDLSTQLGRENSMEHGRLLSKLANSGAEKSRSLLEQALGIAIANNSPTDRIEILVYLGRTQHDATPLRLACELTDSLPEQDRPLLRVNPYATLSRILGYSAAEECLSRAEQAVEFAKKYDDPDQIVQAETCLAWAWYSDGKLEAARKQADHAIDLAIQTSPQTLVDVLRCRLELENLILDRSARLAAAKKVTTALEGSWSETFRNRGGFVLGELIRMSLSIDDDNGVSRFTQLIGGLHPAQQLDAIDRVGDAYRELGQYENAYQTCKSEISMRRQLLGREPSPTDMGTWFYDMRARCLAGSRRFEAALEDFEIALSVNGGIWANTWVHFETATYLELLGKTEEAQRHYASVAKSLTEHPHLYGDPATAAVNAWAMLRLPSPDLSKVRSLLANGEPTEDPDMAKLCWYVSHGLLAEQEGDTKSALQYYRLAMQSRPGTYEQLYAEWIPDRFVELADATGDQDLVIGALQDAIEHRDKRLKSYHPERAYTRIRLAKYLLVKNRDINLVKTLLTEAKGVYAYHGDWIPADERNKLDELIEKVGG